MGYRYIETTKEWIDENRSTLVIFGKSVYCFCQMASSSTSESK